MEKNKWNYVRWLRYLLCFININLVLIGTSPLCPNPDCSRTALKFQMPYKVSIISQTLSIPLNKCTRITRMLAMGAVMAFVLQ